jgi:hypothetical protein
MVTGVPALDQVGDAKLVVDCHQRELRPAMLDELRELDFAFDQFSWAAVEGHLPRLARSSLLSRANSPAVTPGFGY